MADGEMGIGELGLGQQGKEVGLVFIGVGALDHRVAAVGECSALGVVSGSHGSEVVVSSPLPEDAELDVAIAHHVGIGGEALLIAIEEIGHDPVAIVLHEIDDSKRDIEVGGDRAGIHDVLFPWAVPNDFVLVNPIFYVGRLDRMSGLFEQKCSHGAVDAAGKGYQNALSLTHIASQGGQGGTGFQYDFFTDSGAWVLRQGANYSRKTIWVCALSAFLRLIFELHVSPSEQDSPNLVENTHQWGGRIGARLASSPRSPVETDGGIKVFWVGARQRPLLRQGEWLLRHESGTDLLFSADLSASEAVCAPCTGLPSGRLQRLGRRNWPDEWRLNEASLDGQAVLLWTGRAEQFFSNPPQRFKFVTGEGRWFEVPTGAPNTVVDESGNRNLIVDVERTGFHLFAFTLDQPVELSQTQRMEWASSGTQEDVPLRPGPFFFQLATDLPLGLGVSRGTPSFGCLRHERRR